MQMQFTQAHIAKLREAHRGRDYAKAAERNMRTRMLNTMKGFDKTEQELLAMSDKELLRYPNIGKRTIKLFRCLTNP